MNVSRLRLASLLSLAAIAALSPSRPALAADHVRDSEELNYTLRVPEAWVWEDKMPFEKYGAKEVASRHVEKLANGQPGTGQGGRVILTVQDVPKELDPEYESWLRDYQVVSDQIAQWQQEHETEPVPADLAKLQDESRAKIDKALTALAGLPSVQSVLLDRFDKDPKKWPKPTIDGDKVELTRLPAAEIKVKADAPNLEGTPAPCDARMFILVVRKRFYRLAMWAWPSTPRGDREHLLDDLDTIEFGFDIMKKQATPPKTAAAAAKAGAGPAGDDKPDGDSGEEKTITDLPNGFTVVKPKKFKSLPFDRSTAADRDVGFKFSATGGGSEAHVTCLVYRLRGGSTPFSLDRWLTTTTNAFVAGHPVGQIGTMPFPAYNGDKVPFLSLPDDSKKRDLSKELKRSAPGQKDDKPPAKDPKDPKDPKDSKSDKPAEDEITKAEAERLGVFSEVKQPKVGKEKGREAWRFCMYGIADRVGEEVSVDFSITTGERSFVFYILARKEGFKVWHDELAKILSSFKILELGKDK